MSREREPGSPSCDAVMRDNIARLGGDPAEGFETGADEYAAPMEPRLEPPDAADPVLVDEDPILNTTDEP